jgi:microcystin-dependent protein
MKKLITILMAVLLTVSVFAQSPQKMSYQSVIRNASGGLITNSPVGMRIQILQGSEFGTAVYVETQTPTTNANGLATLEIGTGTVVSGNFSTIDWANGQYFLKTETDPLGGTSYTITGTSQLLSVPYALYAESSNSGIPVGTILPFAGTVAPAGYLLCDGSQVSRTTYANLFSVISSAWGNGDGSTTFHLPDFRGRFLRGVDGTAGNDPDKANRTASNTGGNTGNNVGSLQNDAISSHNHNLLFNNAQIGSNPGNTTTVLASQAGSNTMWTASAPNTVNTISIQSNGGNETRPKNVYVQYIIKY